MFNCNLPLALLNVLPILFAEHPGVPLFWHVLYHLMFCHQGDKTCSHCTFLTYNINACNNVCLCVCVRERESSNESVFKTNKTRSCTVIKMFSTSCVQVIELQLIEAVNQTCLQFKTGWIHWKINKRLLLFLSCSLFFFYSLLFVCLFVCSLSPCLTTMSFMFCDWCYSKNLLGAYNAVNVMWHSDHKTFWWGGGGGGGGAITPKFNPCILST